MNPVNPEPVPHFEYHKDGSVLAKGQKLDGLLTGYWEWFRKDGTIMRSGYFEQGEPTGLWTTYDQAGEVHKVTRMKNRKMQTKDGASQ
jgi:antitoxin component YwqK of YwqJK toxin-antitoxin module